MNVLIGFIITVRRTWQHQKMWLENVFDATFCDKLTNGIFLWLKNNGK